MKTALRNLFIRIFLSFLRSLKTLRHPTKFVLMILRGPMSLLWVIAFRLIILPSYKIYIRVRREIVSGSSLRVLMSRKATGYTVFSLFILFISFHLISIRTFAAPDLSARSLVLSLYNKSDEGEILVEEQDFSSGDALGYIPLGFSDLDEDDEEIFSLIAGGGAFLRPLGSVSFGAPTRLDIETHIVEKGDTISAIANKFAVSINTILWANNLTARSLLREGQKLTIPPTTGVVHTVKKGETIEGLASKYKGSVDKIIAFNNLFSRGLAVGQVVVVPDGRVPPPPPPPPRARTPEFVPQAVAGKMFWPTGSKRITQYYWSRHPAIDIGTPAGTPVYASEDGIVEFVKYGRTGYGYQLMIDHGGGVRTRYAHNSKILVQPGDQVQKGQVVSLVGNTGRSTGPHLHFEIFIGSRRVNPLQYIR